VRYSLVTFNLQINEAALLFGIVFLLLLYFQPFIRRSLKRIVHVYLDCSYFGMNTVDIEIQFFESYNCEINYSDMNCRDGLTMGA